MDPLSLVASLAGASSLSLHLSQTLYEYTANIRNKSRDMTKLMDELQSLQVTFEAVNQVLRSNALPKDGRSETSREDIRLTMLTAISRCAEEMQRLEGLFPKLGMGKEVKKIRWMIFPLKREEISQIIARLESSRTTLTLLLQVVTLNSVSRGIYQRSNSPCLSNVFLERKLIILAATSQDIYRWLNAADHSSIHRRARSQQLSGTGRWLLDSEEFVKWSSSAHSFLYLWGIPGSGKSILFSTIVDDIVDRCASELEVAKLTAVAYFYFAFHDSSKQSTNQLLRSLVTQLFRQSQERSSELKALYSQCSDGRWEPSEEKLLLVLQELLRSFHDSYIMIDALDECSDCENLCSMLETMNGFQVGNFHIFVTSRQQHGLHDTLQAIATQHINLRAIKVDNDIRMYVRMRLQETKWPSTVREEVEQSLVRHANGMFIWVALQVEALEKTKTLKRLRQTLESLPRSLDATYERILSNISEQNAGLAKTTFRWLASSLRPLRLEELAEALAFDLDSGNPEFSLESRLLEPKDILDVGSSLITNRTASDSTEALEFAHFSVPEFLASERIKVGPAAFYYISNDSGQFALEMCLTYLRKFESAGSILPETFSAFPLAEYAAKFWTQHAATLEHSSNFGTNIRRLVLDLLRRPVAFANWIRLYDLDDPSKEFPYTEELQNVPGPLYYMSLAGLPSSVRWLLAEDGSREINEIGGRFGSAIQAAAAGGHVEVVKVLLESGADVNLQCGSYGSPLQAATASGQVSVIQLLLQFGADVNLQGGLYGNPLQAAAAIGQQHVTQLLLERGADVNSQGGHYGNALQAAIAKGKDSVAMLLIKAGASINTTGGFYGSPLVAAVIEGHDHMVQALVDHGADVTIERFPNRTLVHEAASLGHVEVVHVLLCTKLQVSSVDNSERTALHDAAAKGHASVLELLLRHEIDADAKDKDGMTALHCAADGGFPAAVKALLNFGADINAIDRQRSTPLHLAIQRRHGAVHRLLIDLGARLDLMNKKKLTPAQVAFKMNLLHPKRFRPDRRKTEKLTKGHQALSVEVLKRKPGVEAQKEKYRFVLKKRFTLKKRGQGRESQLLREYDVLQRLHHPNIVKFLGYKECKGEGWLFMEYCTEGDLSCYIKRDPDSSAGETSEEPSPSVTQSDSSNSSESDDSDPSSDDSNSDESRPEVTEAPTLTCQDIWHLLLQLASALAYCHHGLVEQNGMILFRLPWQTILHRDIKPENIVLTKDDRNLLVAKLCDLGLAKVFDANSRQTRGIGSAKYMPPEVLERREPWTIKGDIFALGATFKDLNLRLTSDLGISQADRLSIFQKCEKSLQTTLDDCIATEAKDRPSSLVILQHARDHLSMLPNDGKWQFHQDGPSQTYEYPLNAILECLESLFYSISETELHHGVGWISRFQLLWDDIGLKTGKTILWSDNENAYLKILLKRPKTRIDQNSEVSLEDLWQPRITSLEGENIPSGCRWNTRKLSAPDLKEILGREFSRAFENLGTTKEVVSSPLTGFLFRSGPAGAALDQPQQLSTTSKVLHEAPQLQQALGSLHRVHFAEPDKADDPLNKQGTRKS